MSNAMEGIQRSVNNIEVPKNSDLWAGRILTSTEAGNDNTSRMTSPT